MAKKQEKAGTSVSTGPGPKSGTESRRAGMPSVSEVVAFCQKLSLTAEQVGRWVWVSFAEKPDEAMRQALRDFGFRWSYRRKKWAHNCGHPTRSARQSDPWQKYDHKFVSNGGAS